jgi:metal-responsive CopG/Arc/MetJ family transcriptional regulator
VQNGRCPPHWPSHGGEAHDEGMKMFAYTKVKLEKGLVDRIRRFAEIAGYSSPEEFITHALEKELAQLEDADSEEEIKKRLQGLGYMS